MYFQPIILLVDKNKTPDEHISEYLSDENIKITPSNIQKYTTEKNSMGIKTLLKLTSEISVKSNEVKAFIIVEAEKMTEEAQNSILKTLEEPNNNSLIILLTYNSYGLLETIRSRCMEIFKKVMVEKKEVEFFNNFLTYNYVQRKKIIEDISKEENSREFALELILYIMDYAIKNRTEISDRLIEIYRGIKQGANLKLSLENISILLT